MNIRYSVAVKINAFNVTVIMEHSCSTEHLLAGNTLLVTSLLNQCTQSLPDPVRCLDILKLKNRCGLISGRENDRTYTKDLLPDRLLECDIQNSV